MEGQEPSNTGPKVIPFPMLSSRLLDKAVEAMKATDYRSALDFFQQLYQIDSDHPQASFGLAVCYVELGAYKEAEELTEQMLKKDIGNYFDVLKLHISMLIQRREYQKVVDIVDAVIEEGQVPSKTAISLKQLADFCQKRLEEPGTQVDDIEKELSSEPDPEIDLDVFSEPQPQSLSDDEFNKRLFSEEPGQQWFAIQNAQSHINRNKLGKLREFLVMDQGDPFLKSIAVNIIKEYTFDQRELKINKFNHTFTITLFDKDDLFNEILSNDVQNHLSDYLEQNNPSLFQMAMEIWSHFIISAFPLEVDHINVKAWAAACYTYVEELNGNSCNLMEIVDTFGTDIEQMSSALKLLKQVEEGSAHFINK